MRREARGFTLLEIVLTLALIGTLSGIALWYARGAEPDARLSAAVRQVVLDLRLTRARAASTQSTQRVLFALATGNYTRQRRTGGTYLDIGGAVALPPGIGLSGCTAPGNAIAFSPRGTASSFGTIVLRNASGREQRVIVDIAGRIRVQ